MPTYSTSLRLTLINDGDETGTWGQTTNVNLGTLLEKGITGYGAVTTGAANQAFTINNGADDEARLACIELDTSTGAAFAVYAPPVPKQYVLRNVGAQQATVYNSTVAGNTTAAGTGVVIPAGKTVHVFSDGTDFFAAQSHLPSLTLTAPLPIASGGTASATAADARTALGAAPLASPAFTGSPTAPTAAPGTNTTQLATTAFVAAATALIPTGVPAGTISMWSTNTAPTGYLLCNGAAVSRTTYADLFAVIGTTYGAGDGSTTFGLPNFTDRMPIGGGNLYALNAQGGSKDAIVVSHTHSVTDPGHAHATTYVGFTGGGSSGPARTTVGTSTEAFNSASNTTGISIASAGSSGTNANLPPYLGIRFIIKT